MEAFAEALTVKLQQKFPNDKIEISGEFRRQLEIIESLEWVTTVSSDELKNYLLNDQIRLVVDRDGMLVVSVEETLFLRFHTVSKKDFYSRLFETSCSEEFLAAWDKSSEADNFIIGGRQSFLLQN